MGFALCRRAGVQSPGQQERWARASPVPACGAPCDSSAAPRTHAPQEGALCNGAGIFPYFLLPCAAPGTPPGVIQLMLYFSIVTLGYTLV